MTRVNSAHFDLSELTFNSRAKILNRIEQSELRTQEVGRISCFCGLSGGWKKIRQEKMRAAGRRESWEKVF